ncbi:DUF58 domain-containing protein [Tautonia rosea]|uniref:DUF58 domain-containing protein n=1 Tax=Tautonia rosea TaxID=2728037 RepID=UPI0014755189|nr:DUF58 domain-containing protein [Tautonia rosea]
MMILDDRELNAERVHHHDGDSRLQRWLLGMRHLLVEADHFSFVNAYLPWRYPLGSLAMAAVAAALCGWFVHARAYLLLIGVGSVIVLGVIWPKVSLLAIRGHLKFEDRRTVEGKGTRARLVVSNYLPIGSWGLRLRGGHEDAGSGSVVNLAVVPGWRTTEFEFPYVPPLRGEYPRGSAALRTGFPFGLWEAERSLATTGSLLVWPRSLPLDDIPEAAASDRTREGLVFQNRAGHSGDFFGVRPYVRGDSLRRIHWPQSARYDRLIVCERQASANLHLQVVLDVLPSVHGGNGPYSSREWAIRIAATLIEAFLNRGALVHLVVDDRSVATGSGTSHRERLLDTLAKIPPKTSKTIGEVLSSSPVRRFRDGLQVVITTDRGLQRADAWPHGGKAIILRAASFGAVAEPERHDRPLLVRPWIEITDANNVAGQFRRGWREVLNAN